MSQVMDLLWEQASSKLYIERPEFERQMAEWEIEEVRVGGDLGGAILRKGPELHFSVFNTGHVATRQIVIDAVKGQLQKYGYVVTKTPKDDKRQARFNALVGFKVVDEDEFDTYYRLEAGDFRYREKMACPS